MELKQLLTERRPALVIIDVQNDFCHPEGKFAKAGLDMAAIEPIYEPIERLASAFRAKKLPVCFITNVEDETTDTEAWLAHPDGAPDKPNLSATRRGSWGAELCRLVPQPGDAVIEKHRFSAFVGTRLEMFLHANDVRTVVLCGVSTNVCVDTTCRHGLMLDYHMVACSDACGAWSAAAHENALDNMSRFFATVAASDEIIPLLK